ncbi:hypothetical protein BC962_1317 [Gillisia mitskevichiae]|uniref:Uncharacterized protein n=1 Tax=Gillisia mitskevichiae TaxID=270921 RepID=A0A495PR01_9FLAO|nr:hypothetical protein [Gillisia mitskevichiae]RKS53071.1 hypothetical protein BC962_1317 [Gillisia mitskevichiae]
MKISTKKLFRLSLFSLCLSLVVSCSDDDDYMAAEGTCTDGIMNGTETGVDCGGTMCEPCTTTMLGRRTELYVTSNAGGNITKYSISGDSTLTFTTQSSSAEGIYYDTNNDLLVQASRSNLQLEAYSDISSFMTDASLTTTYTGAVDLESPRELAVNGNTYVVSDNGSNKFFVYTKSGDSFSLANTVTIPFPVWGITFKGNDLYAVVDTTNDLAVFYDFENNVIDGTLAPSKRISIEGIIRTHGITYDGTDDVLVMTDIGDAANVTDDGGFHIINEFSSKFDALSDGEVLTLNMQTRVAGPSTGLGNPIDVAYDSEENTVYISEIGNGTVLGFSSIGDGGDLSPTFSKDLAGASSIYFSSDETDGNSGNSTQSSTLKTQLYTTNNANGDINIYDGVGMLVKTITSGSTASEGIYYSGTNDILIQASRSDLMLAYYSDFSNAADASIVTSDFSSNADLTSPREIAVSGNKIVVSDNGTHMFYVYSYNGSSFTLENTVDPGFNVWGITFKGDDLLAVVDNSSDLAVFNNFLNNATDGTLSPDKRITIAGIVRTHGIDYNEADDVLVMTDIGDAANATNDGGFQVIQNFSSILEATATGGSISLADQTRVSGASTLLGNPIDVAYDHKTNTVFIAEVGNGKVLAFTNVLNITGDIAPTVSNDLMSASSLFLYNN